MNSKKNRLVSVIVLYTILFISFISAAAFSRSSVGSSESSSDLPVIVEAEDGDLGMNLYVEDEGDITYVTTAENFTGQTCPEDESRMITFWVTFEDSGTYNLFARIRVGSGTYDDDSFFFGKGFGEKDVTASGDWVFVNGLAGAGFSGDSEVVDEQGTTGSEIWKWVKISGNFFQATSPEEAFTVSPDELSQTFQIASREDGLFFDKFAFGKANLYFTVEALDKGLPGTIKIPEEDSSKFYQGPPLAQGSPKFLGNVRGANDNNFAKYWNQLTPGNEGKWGSVATSSDTTRWNWTSLDASYNYAKDNDLIFKDHTLIWGNQQPSWIESLDSAQQIVYIKAWMRMVGERYPDMDMIDVVNEPLHDPPSGATNGNYIQALGGKGETGWDWVIKSFEMARKYLPDTQLLLNDYGIINDNSATSNYLKIINLLNERGLIDGIGVQGHRFELETAAISTLNNNLDRLAATGLPIYISEMELGNLRNEGTADDDQQLEFFQRIFPVVWEHPGVQGITLWGYIQGQMWQSTCYLVLTDGTWRPAMTWLAEYMEDYSAGIRKTVNTTPSTFKLEQNFPNPFNPVTNIKFSIPETARTSLTIYDILGREVVTLVNENLNPGLYDVTWDGRNTTGSQVVSGAYFYRLVAGDKVISQKMLLLK